MTERLSTHSAVEPSSEIKVSALAKLLATKLLVPPRDLREACVPGFSPRHVDSCLHVYMVPTLDRYMSPNSPCS